MQNLDFALDQEEQVLSWFVLFKENVAWRITHGVRYLSYGF
jgi:hypothetical protein